VRRRRRPAADPEVAEALAVLDRYRAVLRAQQAAGDPHARWRLHVLWWARHDIVSDGMDFVSRLRVQGYQRKLDREPTCGYIPLGGTVGGAPGGRGLPCPAPRPGADTEVGK
jgi:hypothetical protein